MAVPPMPRKDSNFTNPRARTHAPNSFWVLAATLFGTLATSATLLTVNV